MGIVIGSLLVFVSMRRELGVSKHTVYAWKAKYGGVSVSEGQRLRQPEDGHQRAKRPGGGRGLGQGRW